MATSRLERIGTIFTRMEGLLRLGAVKPDDRPLWFDIYKAFPPIVEPKFAREAPENKTIRQILYKEDNIRVKFHSRGHGISSNMLIPSETQTKRLIEKYTSLQSEGVPEEEIIEKTLSAIESDRKEHETTRIEKNNPNSVTAQVLDEVDLKNIFKE